MCPQYLRETFQALAPPFLALPYERDKAIGAHTIVALRTDLG